MVSLSSETKDQAVMIANSLIASAMAPLPDNIKQIDAKLGDVAAKNAVKIVLSKTDEEYEANKAKMLEELKAAGVDEYNAWYEKAWADAKASVGAK